MPFGVNDIQEATSITNPILKMAIIGPPGVGKSWFAATAPKPVFDIDFDGRAASLKGKADVLVKTYKDVDPNNPKAMASLEADLGMIEYEKSKGNPTPATYVLDSLTYMRSSTESEIIKQQSSLSRDIRVGSRVMKIGQGFDIVNGNRAYIEYIIGRISVLGNLIVICHEMDEKDKAKESYDKKGNKIVAYSGKITINPQYLNTLLSLFDDVYRLTTNWKNERVAVTGITDDFIGKNSMGLNVEEVNPSIEEFLKRRK